MSNEVLQLELELRIANRGAGTDAGVGLQFKMIQRGDFIKAGWWHWRCRREDAAGEVDYGYIHADTLGHVVLPETFEKDHARY